MQNETEKLNNVNEEVPTSQSLTSDKLKSMPVGKLLFTMALPAIVSMFIESLYNIIDSLYVSKLGQEALDAIGIGRPLIMIIIATAVGIGVGANAFVARQLGFKNRKKADQIAKTSLILAIGAGLVFLALSFFVPVPFVKLFTSNETIIAYEKDYISLYMAFSMFSIVSIVGAKVLQATGNMRVPMISQIVGCVTNIILDPFLIFEEFLGIEGLGMGMKGAAIATIIGQAVSCAYVLLAFVVKKQDVSIFPKGLKFNYKNVWSILNIGLPTFILNAMGSFTTIIINSILKQYENGITVMSVFFICQSFVFMPVFGLTQGTMPILSYNYGANLRHRYNRCFKLSLITALCFMLFGLVIFQFFPQLIATIFSLSVVAKADTVLAFRILSISFLPAAFSILTITLLQSLNAGFYSMSMSLLRQLGFVIPFAFLLNFLFGFKGVFYCYPIAEIFTLLIFLPIAFGKYKRSFQKREQLELLKQGAE